MPDTELAIDPVTIPAGDPRYPPGLRACLGDGAPAALAAIGNLGLLRRDVVALFCSVRCPGGVILRAYDLAQSLREDGVTVAGGFHSPVERDCLDILLRGSRPVILCPARSLERVRIPAALLPALEEGRLLYLSPFTGGERRPTAEAARVRNRLVAALAGSALVIHAEPGGSTEQLAKEVVGWGKPLDTIEDEANRNLLGMGARVWRRA